MRWSPPRPPAPTPAKASPRCWNAARRASRAAEMGVRLDKPWRDLTAANVAALAGELGVYQLAGADGRIVRIGYAGGRTLFGRRSELQAALDKGEAATFRTEVTAQYLSRY